MIQIGNVFFKLRSYTPIPFVLLIIFFAQPTMFSIVMGLTIALCGEALRIWGVGYAGFATRTRNVGASTLVTNGAFGILRNPLYAGNFFISLGIVVIFNALMPYMIIAFALLFCIQYYFIILLEENKLEERFGGEYRAYKASVPRFLPHFRHFIGASNISFALGIALKNERKVFLSISILTIVAILLSRYGNPLAKCVISC